MPRRVLALIGLTLVALVAMMSASAAATASTPRASVPQASAPRASAPAGATVLVGTGGLSWTDVSERATPNLWALLRDGSGGAMSTRSVYTNTCPIDGWLGLSAGGRAAGGAGPPGGGGPPGTRGRLEACRLSRCLIMVW